MRGRHHGELKHLGNCNSFHQQRYGSMDKSWMHDCILRIKVKPIKLYNDNYQTHARDPAKSRKQKDSAQKLSLTLVFTLRRKLTGCFSQSVHQSHEDITHLGWTSHMVGHGVTTMFLIGCMVIARNGRTRWPTNLRLFCVFNLNHPII